MSLGFFHIIKEALILPAKNMKLILEVFLIYIAASITLTAINIFSPVYLLKSIPKQYAEMSETDATYYKLFQATLNQAKEFPIIRFILLVLTFLLVIFVMVIVFHAFALTYTNHYITLKELLHKVKGNLKGPIITQILSGIFGSLYVGLAYFVIGLLWAIGDRNGSVLIVVFSGVALVVAFLWWFYLAAWLLLGIIVSVNEEGCYAFAAFRRASHLTKGSRCKGFWLSLMYNTISVVIVWGFAFGLVGVNSNIWIQRVLEWVGIVLVQAVMFFFWAAMTVYYCECKRDANHEHAGDGGYSRLAGDNV